MSAVPTPPFFGHRIPPVEPTADRYELGFARSESELDAVFALRYAVFNLELDEGLAASHDTGRDTDLFDPFCHHLVVRDKATGEIVGTYRMQTADMARAGRGFYSATEFDLSGFPPQVLEGSLEIGRACIASEHRNLKVLYLLWQGLGRYVSYNRLGYLFGCCSLTSQDPHEATRVYDRLRREGHLDPAYFIAPLESHRCLVADPEPGGDHIPRLMRAYLSLGARIASSPAIDRSFGTIDYLALFNLSAMEPARLAFFRCA